MTEISDSRFSWTRELSSSVCESGRKMDGKQKSKRKEKDHTHSLSPKTIHHKVPFNKSHTYFSRSLMYVRNLKIPSNSFSGDSFIAPGWGFAKRLPCINAPSPPLLLPGLSMSPETKYCTCCTTAQSSYLDSELGEEKK